MSWGEGGRYPVIERVERTMFDGNAINRNTIKAGM
jgi:hypothetical protein